LIGIERLLNTVSWKMATAVLPRVRHFYDLRVSNMKKPEPAKQNRDQRKSVGNFKLSFEALNDNGQSRVAILPLRFSKLDPSNSPVRLVA
jgi:hypothetical protein